MPTPPPEDTKEAVSKLFVEQYLIGMLDGIEAVSDVLYRTTALVDGNEDLEPGLAVTRRVIRACLEVAENAIKAQK